MICYGTFRRNADLIHLIPRVVSCGVHMFETAGYYHNLKYLIDGVKRSGLASDQYQLYYRYTNYRFDLESEISGILYTTKNLNVVINKCDDGGKWIDLIEKCISMKQSGLIRSFGTSNFTVEQLEECKKQIGIYPDHNQFESHPYYQQNDLLKFCKKKKIIPMFNCSLGRGREVYNPIIRKIAKMNGVSPENILLRFGERRGIPIFTSGNAVTIFNTLSPTRVFNICENEIKKLEFPKDYGRLLKKME